MNEIKVTVVKFADRKNLMLRYVCPMTGKQKHKSSGTKIKRDAERQAGKWEAELREGRYHAPVNILWEAFRERYEDEVLASLAPATDAKVSGVFNIMEKIISPKRLADLTADRLSYLQSKLRDSGRSEHTISTHLACINSALRWAVSVGLLQAVPKINRPRRARKQKLMKGRPIVAEEFDRMLDKVEAALIAAIPEKYKKAPGPRPVSEKWLTAMRVNRVKRVAQVAPGWRYYLQGLWLSGLRLAESLELYWDRDDRLCIDLSGNRPMLRIPAEFEKGNRDRLLPITPDFAEFLLATPESERRGRVFNPLPPREKRSPPSVEWVSRIISLMGELANVKVNTDAKGKVKFASAHDLRRSFGERWSSRLMPQVLMMLMRHESIETTLRFYVGRNAQSAADTIWAASGNSLGNSGQKRAADDFSDSPQVGGH